MANQNAIDLLFQVEGQGSLTGKTGNLIVTQLKDIVKQINDGASSVPKIELDVGLKAGVADAIKKELDAINKHSALGKASSVLSSVDDKLTHIMTGLANMAVQLKRAAGSLDDIWGAMPDGSGDALKSIGNVTESVKKLVDEIGELSGIVSEISKKPTSVITNIVGGTTQDAKELELIQAKAHETIKVFQSLRQNINAGLSSGNGMSGDDLSVYQNALSQNLLKAKSDISGATDSASVQKVITYYEELNRQLKEAIVNSNQNRGANFGLPDETALNAASEALKKYRDAMPASADIPESKSEERSILDKAKEMSDACQTIEQTLVDIRSKIESTFDLSTVNTNADKLKAELEAIGVQVQEVKVAAQEIKEAKESGTTDTIKDDVNNFAELRSAMKAYFKEYTDLTKAAQRNNRLSHEGSDFSLDTTIVAEDDKKNGLTKTTEEEKARIEELARSLNRLEEAKRALTDFGISFDSSGFVAGVDDIEAAAKVAGISVQQYKTLVLQAGESANTFASATDKSAASARKTWDGLVQKVQNKLNQLKNVGADTNDSGVAKMMADISKAIKNGTPEDIDKVTNALGRLEDRVVETGADVETWGHKMAKTFGGHLRTALAGLITTKVSQYLRQVYDNVVKLDKATSDLQIATGKTRAEIKTLVKEYSALAKQLSTTTVEIASAADSWLRQGYSIEETTKLIEASTMLSKLGQIEAAEATKALTSALRGYKLEASEVMSITDKLTAVDVEAAVTAGGIATAMAETATSAKLAGIEMDRLIGYITTVTEVTQDSEESVGTFYKTLFARMNNVAAGNFVDEETGESLNDVETVLNELGISLRTTTGLFRNSGVVLDEVADKWDTFNNVQQHAIATAFAGKLVPVRTEMCA